MQTDCSTTLFDFAAVEDRQLVASFDGGTMTSNAGALLLGSADRAVRLVERAAGCFVDRRDPSLIEHSVATLVGQRIFGLALGHEDLVDHDALRHDPLFAGIAVPAVVQSVILKAVTRYLRRDVRPVEIVGPFLGLSRLDPAAREEREGQGRHFDP